MLYAQETIYCFIQNTDDDAYQLYRHSSWGVATGEMFVDSLNLRMGYIKGEQLFYHTGLRYQSVPIPPGSYIESAYIQFTSYEANYDTINLLVSFEDNLAPLPFTNVDYNISDRIFAGINEAWIVPSWDYVFFYGPCSRTVDIKDLVQEIIDMDGWEEDGPMVFFIYAQNTGDYPNPKAACSWEFDGEYYAPQLEVSFYPNASTEEYSIVKSFHIYPNPVENDFTALYTELQQGEYEIAIIDLQGNLNRQIFKGSHKDGNLELKLSADRLGLPSGLYVLRLSGEGAVINQKIVIR